jgi:hypothetical protein
MPRTYRTTNVVYVSQNSGCNVTFTTSRQHNSHWDLMNAAEWITPGERETRLACFWDLETQRENIFGVTTCRRLTSHESRNNLDLFFSLSRGRFVVAGRVHKENALRGFNLGGGAWMLRGWDGDRGVYRRANRMGARRHGFSLPRRLAGSSESWAYVDERRQVRSARGAGLIDVATG